MANKNSKTPRDYSKEYNAPGSKEQEERNKRKRDKRKHDKLYGECPEGTELHHTNGIENDEVECVLVSKNRGRKEKSRKKKGEVVIRIKRKDADVKKLEEQEQSPLNTVGDLRKALSKAIGAKRMGKAKDAAKDIAVGAIFGLVPGAGTAKSVFDIAKSIYSLPDDKKTDTALDYLNVDDDVSKIVDDGIENAFLKVLTNELKKFKDDVPLENLNMTKMLNNYIMRQYNKRKVDSPEDKQ